MPESILVLSLEGLAFGHRKDVTRAKLERRVPVVLVGAIDLVLLHQPSIGSGAEQRLRRSLRCMYRPVIVIPPPRFHPCFTPTPGCFTA